MGKIKKLCVVITFIALSLLSLYAQQNSVNQKLETLLIKLDLYYPEFKNNNYTINLNKQEVNELVKSIYELYSFHWVETNNFIDMRIKKAEKEYKESGGKTSLPEPVLFMARKIINKERGKNFYEIITAPYYLKTKILKINHHRKYKSGNELYPKTAMQCEMIQVIKGEHSFKDGEQIEISYLNHWDVGKYEEGKVYFMPVRPWNCKIETNCEYSPNLFPVYFDGVSMEGGPFGIYPIEDNQIKNADYFKISESSWNAFIRGFKNKYIIGGKL